MAELKDVLNLKDQSGLEALLQTLPLEERRKDILRAIPHLTGGRDVIAGSARPDPQSSAPSRHSTIWKRSIRSLRSWICARHLTIDLGEVRGFDYYTGILFRAYVPQLGFEVAIGGRYDGLPATFGEDLPAVGFSFSLDRLEQIATPKLAVSERERRRMIDGDGFEKALQLRRAGKAVKLCL